LWGFFCPKIRFFFIFPFPSLISRKRRREERRRKMTLTDEFYERLKNVGKPYHQIAWESNITPNQLYKITSKIDRPDSNDPRVKALCKYLGMSIDDAFKS
jgi:hypothetical protein